MCRFRGQMYPFGRSMPHGSEHHGTHVRGENNSTSMRIKDPSSDPPRRAFLILAAACIVDIQLCYALPHVDAAIIGKPYVPTPARAVDSGRYHCMLARICVHRKSPRVLGGRTPCRTLAPSDANQRSPAAGRVTWLRMATASHVSRARVFWFAGSRKRDSHHLSPTTYQSHRGEWSRRHRCLRGASPRTIFRAALRISLL